ncbi:MAG: NUDIX domain-containing protein [Desulfurococcales archaeon]|nr:NUDIX domain-containing protein [Desulfurococcales archaeon]
MEPAAVLVAYNRDGVLMVHKSCREGYPWSCDLAFPGGRLKKGEAVIDGALREAREEVCLDSGSVAVRGILPPERPLNNPDIKVYPVIAEILSTGNVRVCNDEIDRVIIVPWYKICDSKLGTWVHPMRKIAVNALVITDELAVWGMSLRILNRLKNQFCRRLK